MRDVVSGIPPGEGLSEQGQAEALRLRASLARDRIDLAVVSELVRTHETLELALGARRVPRLVLADWNEIQFGSYEGGPLEAYRAWAWSDAADADPPGGGESRGAVAARVARVLELLLGRDETSILAVGHALPVRYVIDATAGRLPQARIGSVPHAVPHRLDRREVATAAAALRCWSSAPVFAAPPT